MQAKNNHFLHRLASGFALLCLLALLWPQAALAYNFTQPQITDPPIDTNYPITDTQHNGGPFVVCPQMDKNAGDLDENGNPIEDSGLTRRIVPCVKETLLFAVANDDPQKGPIGILPTLSKYMTNMLAACVTLAIAFWGISIMMGKHQAPMKDAMTLWVKIGLVVLFTGNVTNFYGGMLDGMEEMLTLITRYVYISPAMDECPKATDDPTATTLVVWDAVDCAISTLTGGIFSKFTLTSGVLGFFVACLFSNNPAGFLIALLGFFLIIQFLYAIARAVYIYMTAYVALALMVGLSPFFVPLVLFTLTRPYFDKYLRIFIMFWLQPFFLIAYLILVVGAFDVLMYGSQSYSLGNALTGGLVNDGNVADDTFFTKYGGLGGWLEKGGPSGSNFARKELMGEAITVNPEAVAKAFPKLKAKDLGSEGVVTQQGGLSLNNYKNGIFDALGIGLKTDSDGKVITDKNGRVIPDKNRLLFSERGIPVNGVDWIALAGSAHMLDMVDDPDNPPNKIPDPSRYLVNLCIAMLMAALTAYVFKIMLDYVPYIGSGVAEMGINMPRFGINSYAGNMAPPGQKMMDGLQDRFNNLFRGGKR